MLLCYSTLCPVICSFQPFAYDDKKVNSAVEVVVELGNESKKRGERDEMVCKQQQNSNPVPVILKERENSNYSQPSPFACWPSWGIFKKVASCIVFKQLFVIQSIQTSPLGIVMK